MLPGSARRLPSSRSRTLAATVSGHLFLYLLAVGVVTALTPWAIVGVIVMLGSHEGLRAAVAFTLGWFCAVTFIAAAVAAGLGRASESTQDRASTVVFVIELVLGLVLLVLAWKLRARRRTRASTPQEPRWLTKLDGIGPVVAFAFGTFMINVVFVVDAGLRIAAADLAASDAAVAVLFYSVLSTAALLTVLVVFLSDRESAETRLHAMRAWLAANNALVSAAIVGLVGVVLALKGAAGLIA
jgi:hypothetical protein